MSDNYPPSNETRSSPGFVAITPHNSTNIASPVRGIYVGVGGDVVVVGLDGAAVTFKNVPTGAVLPVQAIRVNSTSTTATDMVGLY